jgi:hypothetical protein
VTELPSIVLAANIFYIKTIGISAYGLSERIFKKTIGLLEYRISGRQVRKTIGLSDVRYQTQTIGLSDIGRKKKLSTAQLCNLEIEYLRQS